MAQVMCPCGKILSSILLNNGEDEIIYIESNLWQCHDCGRLALEVYRGPDMREPIWYVKENNKI